MFPDYEMNTPDFSTDAKDETTAVDNWKAQNEVWAKLRKKWLR